MRSVRLLGRLSLAHARRHRARMMLLGAGVMVGVASVTAVLALSRSVIDTFAATLVHGAGAAQLQVSNGTAGLDRDLVDVIARLPGVAATGATVEHHVVLPAANRRITIFGAELGRDEAYREAQIGRDVAGIHDVLTFLAHTDSIAVSPALLAANGWKIGDTIDVVGVRGQRTLTIRGTVRSQGFLQAFGGDVALMDLDAAQLQFEAGDRVHWIDVVVAQGADVETVQTTISAALQGRGVVETPAARGRRMDELLSMLRVLLTGTNVVAMIVGIFLIHHALAQSYRQRRADFVRLRALGLSRWGLVAYVVTEAAALGIVASLAGTKRLLLHGRVHPNVPGDLERMPELKERWNIAAWKTYTGFGPGGKGYFLDDPKCGIPFIERARALGIKVICVHKGLPLPLQDYEYSTCRDIGVVAKAFPDMTFIVYHSGYEHGNVEGPYREGNPGIDALVTSLRRAGVRPNANVYVDLGTTWWNLMRDPTQGAHAWGKLLRFVGEDNVIWGTDSIFYGSPQDQIQALRAFHITPEFQERYGYPELTKQLKDKIAKRQSEED